MNTQKWTPPYRIDSEQACREFRRRYRVLMNARIGREQYDSTSEQAQTTTDIFVRAVEDARIDQALPWDVAQQIAEEEERHANSQNRIHISWGLLIMVALGAYLAWRVMTQ